MNALANPEVGKFLNENFVSSFQKVATFRIVNGQKQGGNVASYFCAPDGRVLHIVAGPVDAATLLREAKWVVETTEKAMDECKDDGARFKAFFRKAHAERLKALADEASLDFWDGRLRAHGYPSERVAVTLGGGVQSARRRASSSSSTSSRRPRPGTSRVIQSPSRTRPSGPPTAASGATCSTTAP